MPKPRKKNQIKLFSVLHVFCEGEKSEPNYLNHYICNNHPGNRKLKIIKVEKTNKNTPIQLVEFAIQNKNNKDTPQSDEFWVVYDRESIAKYPNDLHKQAYDKAMASSINVVISNICFELWILLHLADTTASYACCDDLIKNSRLKEKLKENGIEKYDKGDNLIFQELAGYLEVAKNRARKMNTSSLDASPKGESLPYLLNPYTNIYELLEAIDIFVEREQKITP